MRYFLSIILASILLFGGMFPSVVSAHPLDVSSTTLTIRGNRISATTFLHPAEVERILGLRGIPMRSLTYADYYRHESYIFDYLRPHVNLSVAWKDCRIDTFSTRECGVDEIYSEGFPVAYEAVCPAAVRDSLDVKISIFIDLPLQTNRVKLFDDRGNPIGYKVLTSSISSHRFDLSGASTRAIDTDRDGLSDEEERAYRTDPTITDTDHDNYSDAEEVNNGWNPLSSALSPGQKYRSEPLPTVDTGSIDPYQDELSRRYVRDTGLLDASGYGAGYLRDALSAIVRFMDHGGVWSFASLFGLVVFLGFVHAAGPGHSKSLLAAFALDRRNGWGRSFAFALIFTVTHLADITLLVLVTKYLFSLYDPTPYMTLLQRGGAVLLVWFATFISVRAGWRIYASLRAQRSNLSANDDQRLSRRYAPRNDAPDVSVLTPSNIFLGFFAGLAPCTFGWSIYLVLFSLGRMEWALPLLIALGLGIFACLALVVVLTILLREKLLVRVPRFVLYSEIVSALSIVLVAGFVILAVF